MTAHTTGLYIVATHSWYSADARVEGAQAVKSFHTCPALR
jgi:hypothetical protein